MSLYRWWVQYSSLCVEPEKKNNSSDSVAPSDSSSPPSLASSHRADPQSSPPPRRSTEEKRERSSARSSMCGDRSWRWRQVAPATLPPEGFHSLAEVRAAGALCKSATDGEGQHERSPANQRGWRLLNEDFRRAAAAAGHRPRAEERMRRRWQDRGGVGRTWAIRPMGMVRLWWAWRSNT